MAESSPDAVDRRWLRRGLALLVVLWVVGIVIALPRYVARREQESRRGAARVAEARLEANPASPADGTSSAGKSASETWPAVLLLGVAWGAVGGLAWWWRAAMGGASASETESAPASSPITRGEPFPPAGATSRLGLAEDRNASDAIAAASSEPGPDRRGEPS